MRRLDRQGEVFRLSGEVDLANHDAFDDTLTAIRTGAATSLGASVVIDLSGLDFIDVGGITKLARLGEDLASDARVLRLDNAPRSLRRCSEIIGFEPVKRAIELGDAIDARSTPIQRAQSGPTPGAVA